MNDAFGFPQSVLLVGGTSDIGSAVVDALGDKLLRLALTSRRPEDLDVVAKPWVDRGIAVTPIQLDVTAVDQHDRAVTEAIDALGDIDLVIVAHGVLGDHERARHDGVHVHQIMETNFSATAALLTSLAERVRAQGHGTIVVLSSVAAERARPANYIYGASKAGLDAFAQGLAMDLEGDGGRVLIVRPGFVHTKMTEGMDAAPLSTTPEAVGAAVRQALVRRRRVVWVPGALRWMMLLIRHLPTRVVARLPR